MKKVLVPRVRFKGFDEEWKEERLENIYSFASEGGTPDTNKDIYYKPGLFYFTKIEDMANKYISHTKAKISELGLKNSSAWIIPKNNILFSNGATIGNVSINKVDLSTKQGIVGMIIKKKFNLEFIYYLLKSENFQSKVAEKITVGTIPTVAIFNLKKIELFLSKNIYEQQKIGKLLENIDNLITHEEIKLNKLKQLRETLLQKMFPEGNSKVPRIRFKGFYEEWKEYKFNDIGSYYSTSSLSYNDLSKGGQYKCVLYGELYTKYNERIFNVISRTNKKITLTQPNDILFPTSTTVDSYSLISPSCVNEENVMAGGDLFGIRPYKNINGNFISYYINNVEYIKNKLANKAQGLTIIHLYYKNILNENLYIASLEEQNKIAKLFVKIDILINLYNSKLNKLRQIKEALLQNMFV